MKIFKAGEVEVKPFVPFAFNQNEATLSKMEMFEILHSKNSKRKIRELAEREELSFDKEKVVFARKMIKMMMDEISNGK